MYIEVLTFIEGIWSAADATGCSNACGQDVGDSGKAGAVTCSKTTGCDESQKPAAKQCPATPECGGYSCQQCLFASMIVVGSKAFCHFDNRWVVAK